MTAEEREQGTIAYVALGSNIDDREHYLQDAITALNQESGITVTGLSSIYETEPVGYVDQSAFLNMVIQIHTVLPAEELLLHYACHREKTGSNARSALGPANDRFGFTPLWRPSAYNPRLDHSASADA